jgi:hypothetical protein
MRRIGYFLTALLFATSANAAFDQGDLICETTTTTGTGTVSLGGALTNYVTFVSQIASGDTTTYTIEASDGTLETGTGVFTDGAPDTLTRVAVWSTDGVGAELTLPAGTHTVCQSFNTDFFFGGISALELATLTLVGHLTFDADATSDIGTSTVGVNDLHIGSTGGVINWDGGDLTMTHTATSTMSFAGGSWVWGHTASLDTGDVSTIQVHGASAAAASGAIGYWANDATGPRLSLSKSRGAIGTYTAPSLDDQLGEINFRGANNALGDMATGCSIGSYLDAEAETAGDTSDMPGRLEIRCSSDGTHNPAQSGQDFAIKANGGVIIGNGTTSLGGNGDLTIGDDVVVGGTSILDLGDQNPSLQVHGIDTSAASIGIAMFSADTTAPRISLNKSRDAIGTFTTVLSADDGLGAILFGGTEESGSMDDSAVVAAFADAEWATAGDTTDNPGRLTFSTVVDGSSTSSVRMTIKNDGGIIIGNGTTSPGAEDLSLEGGDIEFGNAGTAGTDTTLSYAAAGNLNIEGSRIEKAGTQMIYIPAAAMISRATSGADCSATLDSGAADLTMRVCNFDTAADEWAHFTISMPPRWNEGTVTAQYVWSTTGASTPGETVSIDISCVAISDDDPLNGTLGTPVNVDDTMLSADGDSHLSAVSGAVTCGGTPAANDTVVFAVMRDISDDNVAADMSLIGVRLFITTDTANDG